MKNATFNKELASTYSLAKDDFWALKRKGKIVDWIIKHEAVRKIMHLENMAYIIKDWKYYPYENGGRAFVHVEVAHGDPQTIVHMIGECWTDGGSPTERAFVMSMALKRAIDRGALVHVMNKFGGEQLYSDSEANWKDIQDQDNPQPVASTKPKPTPTPTPTTDNDLEHKLHNAAQLLADLSKEDPNALVSAASSFRGKDEQIHSFNLLEGGPPSEKWGYSTLGRLERAIEAFNQGKTNIQLGSITLNEILV